MNIKKVKLFSHSLTSFLLAMTMFFTVSSCEVSSDGGIAVNTPTPPSENEVYQFHSTITYLPEGTDGTAGTSGTYCLFGDWPQTIKKHDIEVDFSHSIKMGGATYYLGSDNNYYVKCIDIAYKADYTYSDETSVNKGNTQYFKVEPIKWRVLNPDATSENKILLAEKALTANVPYYGIYNERTLNEITIYANNYMYSNIRAYLNGKANQFITEGGTASKYDVDWTGKGFLQTAFTVAAQDLITDTKIDNSASSTNLATNVNKWNGGENNYACGETDDKIFVLSEKEVTAIDYGFAEYNVYIGDKNCTMESARVRKATDFAIARGVSLLTSEATYGVCWWLRSSYYFDGRCARNVGNNGNAFEYQGVNDSSFGIVPALSISSKI